MANHKEQLDKLIGDIKTKKFRDGEAKGLMSSIQAEQTNALRPVLESMAKSIGDSLKEQLSEAVKNIKVEVPKADAPQISVNVPDVNVPPIKVPRAEVIVNVPPIKIPDIIVPKQEVIFPPKFKIDADKSNPLNVILTDGEGRTYSVQQIISGGGGSKIKQYTEADTDSLIKGISVLGESSDTLYPLQLGSGVSDRALRVVHAADSVVSVNMVTGSVSIADGTLVQTLQLSGSVDSVSVIGSVEVKQVSGSVDSVSVVGGTITPSEAFANPTNAINNQALISGWNGAEWDRARVGSTDGDASGSVAAGAIIVASHLKAYNGASWDRIRGGSGVSNNALRIVQATDSVSSVNVVSSEISIETKQVSGAIDSVYITGAAASTYAELLNPDGRVKVELPTGSSGLTDTELRAAHLDVQQMSGSVDSVVVNSFLASLEVKQVSGSTDSVSIVSNIASLDVIQVSGSVDSVVVNSFLTSLEVKQVSGFADSVYITGSSGSMAVALVDSGGIAYSGSNPIPVDLATALDSTVDSVVAVGNVANDAADSGNPLKIGGIARTANPTAVANADRVDGAFDDLGRQVITPYQVRDLVATAYLALANGTETALLAGAASTFHDLMYIMGANQSDVAVDVDFRSGTGGSVVFSLTIPADATAGVALPVPIPQTEVAQTWTADIADITGTVVNLSALFIKNV